MTTGPMGELRPGWTIDGEWEVDDVFWQAENRIFVLKRIKDGIVKYLDKEQLYKLFSGERVR